MNNTKKQVHAPTHLLMHHTTKNTFQKKKNNVSFDTNNG